MGESSVVDPRRRCAYSSTPPGLPSPETTYSSASSPAPDQGRTSRIAAHFPALDYDHRSKPVMSADQLAKASQGRTEPTLRAAPRQQLPSLSSLFGPPLSRSLHSPHAERFTSHSSTSPLDRPGPLSGERASVHSYFPPTASPPISQPRSTYDVKLEERQPLLALARSFSASGSPAYRDVNQGRSHSGSEVESAARWSVQHESRNHEYALASREPSYRSHHDHQFRLKFPRSKEAEVGYSDPRSGHNGPQPPPRPSSTGSEGPPTKDGLGPKIWTGTHFLPRFVKAGDVPGEGMCYSYDDGSHCKTVIDGEAVNAYWGVTKAGKPRKRLAIACITCREKKIKCDPDYPRCIQCEKFGRICKFKNAPRGGHNTSPSTPPAEVDNVRKMGGPPRSSEIRLPMSKSNSPVSPRDEQRSHTPEMSTQKRRKVEAGIYTPLFQAAAGNKVESLDHSKSQAFPRRPVSEMPRIPEDVLSRAWRADPYVSEPRSINATIARFFANIEGTMILRFLPEERFMAWVANSAGRKSTEDLMLLYSILAVGVALSGGPKHIAYEYAQVAQYAQKSTALNCLQLVQCRILLAVYYASVSRLCECNELLGAAAGTAACLQLNVELDKSDEADMPVFLFGMNREAYAEARRSTLWSLFLLERLNGMFPERLTMVDADDIYVRLPSDIESFGRQTDAHMPMFDPWQSCLTRTSGTALEIRSLLVEMVHLWSCCQTAIYRSARRSQSSERSASVLQGLIDRLQDWHAALPRRMSFGDSELRSALLAGNASSLLTMHLLYNHAMIKLNRYRHAADELPASTRMNHLRQCCSFASNILGIAGVLDRVLRTELAVLRFPPPVVAVAITEAVDVLTAQGSFAGLSSLIENIHTAETVVEGMDSVWEESRGLKRSIDARLQMLAQIRDRGSRPTESIEGYRIVTAAKEDRDETGQLWQLANPIARLYPKNMDIAYNLGVEERRTQLPA